jgi:hypothetical protein
MDNSISELLSSMVNMSLNTDKEVKLKARDMIRQLPNRKLDKLIDIVSDLQRTNIKIGFNLIHHKTCNNILLMIMERKIELT